MELTTRSFEELNPRMDTPKAVVCQDDAEPMYVCLSERVDMVNAPPHYTELDPQPIEVIESWRLDFHRAQVLKYIARAGRKGDALTDLQKAKFYLDRAIAIEEGR